jgi:uncharacterized protein YdhG (YjbR/CyaY superfamily)
MAPRPKFSTIEDYINSYPPEVQISLQKIRQSIKDQVPEGTEGISYGIPVINFGGTYLLYFAGFKAHLSVYPITWALETSLENEIKPYRSGRGTLKFSLDKPIPYDLIGRLAKIRAQEILAKTKAKK